jgi:hypothetical protein
MYMTYKTKLKYKLKLKIVKHILIWFEIIINFQNEMKNLTKYTHFEIIFIHGRWLTKKMWYIGTTICIFNNKLQKIPFIFFYMNKWKKLKKICNHFIK